MKKIILICIAIISIYCIACKDKKVEPNYDIVYLDLKDKPLDTIKSYIKGKWQYHYAQGPIGGKQYKENTFIEFIFNVPDIDSIKFYDDTAIFANGRVYFYKQPVVVSHDSSYTINFLYRSTTPSEWIANNITNDTLELTDNFDDGGTRFLTKIK